MAVGEALARLHVLASIGARSLLPAAVGQRFEVLRSLVAPGGPLVQVGCRVAKALDDLSEHRCLRNFLCHGSSEVSIDGQSAWRLTLSMTSFRSGAIERSTMQVTDEEAAVLLQDLRLARLRLDGQLLGMLASLTI